MKNLKELGRFVNLIRNTRVNIFNFQSRDYTCICISSSPEVNNNTKNPLLFKNECSVIKQNNIILNCGSQLRSIFSSQTLEKGKDRGGGKDKKKPKGGKLDLRELSGVLDVEGLSDQMSKSIDNLPVKVDGKEYKLQELAQIARKPKMLVLNLAAFPTAIPHVIKAVEKSGLNINPQQDGTTVFMPIPKVTKEHRETLSKNAKAIFVKYRDQIKDIRTKSVKSLSKKDGISQDQIRRMQTQVEGLCEKYLKEANLILESKQNELTGGSD
ncbi:unnamed protein product [Trichogramma brassicae]|uniref:Ribosome-recycling factor, mitochondrial n=1 Tax=Trichogramma brassicae TaxID=86971 RepID=A0A6H5HYX6_9HYME|nr:unnamed protein product [Trichogramma brassicae]